VYFHFSYETAFLPQADAKMREPVSEQDHIFVLPLRDVYLDELQYPTVHCSAVVIR
jgi:hypothetical protein